MKIESEIKIILNEKKEELKKCSDSIRIGQLNEIIKTLEKIIESHNKSKRKRYRYIWRRLETLENMSFILRLGIIMPLDQFVP